MASTNNIKQLLKFHFLDINSYDKYTWVIQSGFGKSETFSYIVEKGSIM